MATNVAYNTLNSTMFPFFTAEYLDNTWPKYKWIHKLIN